MPPPGISENAASVISISFRRDFLGIVEIPLSILTVGLRQELFALYQGYVTREEAVLPQ